MWGSNPSSNVQAQKSVISEIMLDAFQLAVCYHTHSNYFFYCFSIITCSQKNMKSCFCSHIPFQCFSNDKWTRCCKTVSHHYFSLSNHIHHAAISPKKQSKTKTAITDKHVSVKFNHFQIEFRTTICQHHSSIMNGSQNIWLFLKIVCLTLIAWIPNNNYYPL